MKTRPATLALPALLALSALAETTNLVYTTGAVGVAPYTKTVVTADADGGLKGAPELWSRLEAISVRHGITNRAAVVDAFLARFAEKKAELQSLIGTAPASGLVLMLRFPLDNSSASAGCRIYTVSNRFDAATGYDVFEVSFSEDVPEVNMVCDYLVVDEYGELATNTVAGLWRVADYPGSAFTNSLASVAWRDWTYPNVHTLYVRRPAGFAGFLHDHHPHGAWDEEFDLGSTVLSVNGHLTISDTIYNTNTLEYVTLKNGFLQNPGVQSYAPTVGKSPGFRRGKRPRTK